MLIARTLKGFPDFLPNQQSARLHLFSLIGTVFEHFGFQPMSTPVLEYKELLTDKYGDDEKLMYTFTDHGGREVAMRYDQTVPLARFYTQHKEKLSNPFKRYSISPVWRADNTQRGRLREFYQCDVDTLGVESTVADSEILACFDKTFSKITDLKLQIQVSHRNLYHTLLKEEFKLDDKEVILVLRAVDKFDKQGQDGVVSYLKTWTASKDAIDAANVLMSLGTGPEALDFLETNYKSTVKVVAEIREIILNAELLGARSGVLVFNPLIVRGLDYYTGMVFEPSLVDYPQYGSVGGGGRYDSLLSMYGSVKVPAVGFGMGIDRIFEVLEDQGLLKEIPSVEVVVFNMDEALKPTYLSLVTSLRENGIKTTFHFEHSKLDKQFRFAEKVGAKYCVLLGSAESLAGTVKLKELSTRAETILSVSELPSYINTIKS
jgi:histidyl-tRNA synthetase